MTIIEAPPRLASPDLEVRDLRVVIALGTAGTTAGAAGLLHLTQSAVSRALAAAEAHAGVELFTRTARGLVPTAAGELLLDSAPAMLAELLALERRLREPLPGPRCIRMVAQCYMAYPWFTRVVLRLRQNAPGLRLELPVEHTEHPVEALRAGQLDAAMLLHRPPPGLWTTPLFEDELLFLVARSHPLASKEQLEADDLCEHTMLVPNARGMDEWFVREVFGRRRPRLRVERLPVTEAIVALTRAGQGIGVLSEWITTAYIDTAELRVLRLATGPLKRSWTLACRPELEPVAPLLLDAITGARPIRPPPSSA